MDLVPADALPMCDYTSQKEICAVQTNFLPQVVNTHNNVEIHSLLVLIHLLVYNVITLNTNLSHPPLPKIRETIQIDGTHKFNGQHQFCQT